MSTLEEVKQIKEMVQALFDQHQAAEVESMESTEIIAELRAMLAAETAKREAAEEELAEVIRKTAAKLREDAAISDELAYALEELERLRETAKEMLDSFTQKGSIGGIDNVRQSCWFHVDIVERWRSVIYGEK